MIPAAALNAFEAMAQSGSGDAGALAVGLRREVTGLGLRALAAKAVHVAAAAPERMADVFDNAASGWLSQPIFPPRLRSMEPLPISGAFWKTFWSVVAMPADAPRDTVAERLLELAGKLHPQINPRMAAAALEFPGVAEAAGRGIPEPYTLDGLAHCSPASLGHAVREQTLRTGGLADPFKALGPLLPEMPPPLGYVNVQVIHSLTPLGLVAGYRSHILDQMGLGGFLMAQVGHHYSALATAVTLTAISLERPEGLEIMLDCIFKGWIHGRETAPLIGTPWEDLWDLRIDQVRQALCVSPFDSPLAAAMRAGNREPPRV